MAAVVAAVALLFVGDTVIQAVNDVVGLRLSAMLGGEGAESGRFRLALYKEIVDLLAIRPLGIGFGITPGLDTVGGNYHGVVLSEGQISLLGAFLVAGGLPAGILLMIIVIESLRRVIKVPLFGVPIGAGLLALSLHHLVVSEYWLPFFWFGLAAASAFSAAQVSQGASTRVCHFGVGARIAFCGVPDVEA